MSYVRSFITVLFTAALLACTEKKPTDEQTPFAPKHLIEVASLIPIIDHDSVKVIDIRKSDEYLLNHIPNAINIWRTDIEENTLPYAGMKASKGKIEKLFSTLGIRTTDYLIIYDNNASCDAARLWWLLDFYGFTNTAILNGGMRAWNNVAELTTEINRHEPSEFLFPKTEVTDRFITLNGLQTEMNNIHAVIVDSRSREEYNGDYMKNGAFDQGRIPGSIHIEWSETMNQKTHTFKSQAELISVFESRGVTNETQVITYCHSGVRSAHTLFVLTQILGFEAVKNYDGSWIEWSYHKLPLVRGGSTKGI